MSRSDNVKRRVPLGPSAVRRMLAAALALVSALALTSCARAGEPVRVSRDALGTIVTITAYGSDRAALDRAVEQAFSAISESERVLSAYPDDAAEPDSARPAGAASGPSKDATSVAAFNRQPYTPQVLPKEVADILGRIQALRVERFFSPSMLRVVGLYNFESGGTVPNATELAQLVDAAHAFETTATPRGLEGVFLPTKTLTAPLNPTSSSLPPPAVGLDLSGAAKGAALDAGLAALDKAAGEGGLDGALISAGSTTLVTGAKPAKDGAWRVGIEDPRSPDKVIGIVEFKRASDIKDTADAGPGTVSTSGDYQQSFERNGVRYHHILDPATGEPARKIRSLTVVGAKTGLDSDMLSTALFVMGPQVAESYAEQHGLGLFIVDAEGRTRIVPGPAGSPWTITAQSN